MASGGKHQRHQTHRCTRFGKPTNNLQGGIRTIRQACHRQVITSDTGKSNTQRGVRTKGVAGSRIVAARRPANAMAYKEGHGPRLRPPLPHKRRGKTIHIRGIGQERGTDNGLQPQALGSRTHALVQVGLGPSVDNHTGHDGNPARAGVSDLLQHALQLGRRLTAASQKPAHRRATKSQLARYVNGIGHRTKRGLDRRRARPGTRGAIGGKHDGVHASAGARFNRSAAHA